MKEIIEEINEEDIKIDEFIEKVKKILTDSAMSLENEEHKNTMLNLLKDV